MTIWIARNSDRAWMVQGFGDPALIHTEPQNYTAVEVPGACPDPRLTRHDASAPSKTRAATAAERKQYDDLMVRDKELGARLVKALAVAIHKRFKAVVPTDTTTPTQWEAAIRSEWDVS